MTTALYSKPPTPDSAGTAPKAQRSDAGNGLFWTWESHAAGGVIANIGVHGKPASLHLETLWDRTIAITTCLVETAMIPMRLKTVAAKRIDPTLLITHHFTLAEGEKAYKTFGKTKALKVSITP